MVTFICFGWVVDNPQRLSAQNISNSWCRHSDGGFKYPSTYKHSKTFVEDVPAYVKVLVLIYPQSEKKKVSTLLNIVKDW